MDGQSCVMNFESNW